MTDFAEYLRALHRPRLLIAAALHATSHQCLPALRHSFGHFGPTTISTAQLLVVEEQSLNERRVSGDASYPSARHVAVLAALMWHAT